MPGHRRGSEPQTGLSTAASPCWTACRACRLGPMKVAIELTEPQASRLREEASRLGVAPEDLARAAVTDLLSTPGEDFRTAADYVLREERRVVSAPRLMRHLTLAEVVHLHDQIRQRSGGAGGIRDLGALESAITQPKATFERGSGPLPDASREGRRPRLLPGEEPSVRGRQQARRARGHGNPSRVEWLRVRRQRRRAGTIDDGSGIRARHTRRTRDLASGEVSRQILILVLSYGSTLSCGRPCTAKCRPADAAASTTDRRPPAADSAHHPKLAAVSCSDEMDSSRDSRGIECQSRLAPRNSSGEEESEMQSTTIAVDLAKSVFEVAVSQRPGKVARAPSALARAVLAVPRPSGRRRPW